MDLVYASEDICDNVSHREVVGIVGLASSKKGLKRGNDMPLLSQHRYKFITIVIMYCQIVY
jgi:hypothetical protein